MPTLGLLKIKCWITKHGKLVNLLFDTCSPRTMKLLWAISLLRLIELVRVVSLGYVNWVCLKFTHTIYITLLFKNKNSTLVKWLKHFFKKDGNTYLCHVDMFEIFTNFLF